MTRRRKTGGRIAVLGTAFALFLVGVAALSLDRGGLRSGLLAVSLAGLVGVAVLQTVRNGRKKKN